MRYKDKYIGNVPESLLIGKVTMENLRIIADLLNKTHKEIFNNNLNLVVSKVEKGVNLKGNFVAEYERLGGGNNRLIWVNKRLDRNFPSKKETFYMMRVIIDRTIMDLRQLISFGNPMDRNKVELYMNQLDFIDDWVDLAPYCYYNDEISYDDGRIWDYPID